MDGYSTSDNLNHGIKPFRIVLKSLVLFIGFNLLLTSFPNLSYFMFKPFLPKLRKFPIDIVYYDSQARHGFGVQNVFDVNVLFNTHIISQEKKRGYQYRIIFIGDSTIRDSRIYPILNQQGCAGKNLQAYDLGYYSTSATKDLMILQEAMKYSPDLVVWSLTSDTLSNEPKVFALANSADLVSLINTYDLSVTADQSYTSVASLFHGADEILLQTRLVINYEVLFPAFGNTQKVIQIGLHDVRTDNTEEGTNVGNGANLYSALAAAQSMVGSTPLIVINEPRPSSVVTQPDYLEYRQKMLNLARGKRWSFLDLWNLVPDQDFLDTIHRTAGGETLFDKATVPAILDIACGKK